MWEKIVQELHQLAALVFIFLLPSCLLGGLYWRRLPRAFRILVVYLWFDLAIEIGARVLGYITHNNLPLLHVYTWGEMLLWSLFYREILHPSTVFVRYFQWITGIVLALVILNSVFLQGPTTFNSYAKTLVQLMVILYALSYAFNFLLEDTPTKLWQKVVGPINAAVLFYYCGSLFIFMFSNLANPSNWVGGFEFLWDVNIILYVIFQAVVLFSLCRLVILTPQRSSF
ncbi:MAG: hypothetical protein ABIO24_11270 [Saprospiraceae bacterium]